MALECASAGQLIFLFCMVYMAPVTAMVLCARSPDSLLSVSVRRSMLYSRLLFTADTYLLLFSGYLFYLKGRFA